MSWILGIAPKHWGLGSIFIRSGSVLKKNATMGICPTVALLGSFRK